jgi:hypothetical protein
MVRNNTRNIREQQVDRKSLRPKIDFEKHRLNSYFLFHPNRGTLFTVFLGKEKKIKSCFQQFLENRRFD